MATAPDQQGQVCFCPLGTTGLAYRVPKEWASMGEEQRGVRSLRAFKRRSREGFLLEYGSFVCGAIFKSLLVITAIFAKTNQL